MASVEATALTEAKERHLRTTRQPAQAGCLLMCMAGKILLHDLGQWLMGTAPWQSPSLRLKCLVSATERDLSQHVVQAFPPWLDLPPGYIVNDWIAWEKVRLVAKRLREQPSLLQVARERLKAREDRLFAADLE